MPNLLCSSQLCSLSLLTMRLSCYTGMVVLDVANYDEQLCSCDYMLLISMKFLPFLASVNVIINYENCNSCIFSATLTTGQENERAMGVLMIGLSLCHFCFFICHQYLHSSHSILPDYMQLIPLYKGFFKCPICCVSLLSILLHCISCFENV